MSEHELKPDELDEALKSLDLFEPSMRFSKNVLEQVKTETTLVKPERGVLYWIPRVFISSAALVLILMVIVITGAEGTMEVLVTENLRQTIYTGIGLLGGLGLYALMDRLFKKLVAG